MLPTITHPLTDLMAERIRQWEQHGDRRVIFLACYALMTQNMLQAIPAGRFQDPAWVTELVHKFANYYFVALAAYDRGDLPVPAIWQMAHDETHNPKTPVVAHLLLGVNAHINYDLVLVLVDMLRPVWPSLTPAQRQLRHQDYWLVNTIIGETIDTVQDNVVNRYSPVMDPVDRLLGPLDEWCTARLIAHWRADVWQHAVAMMESPDKAARQKLRQAVEARALQRARMLCEGGETGARVFGYPLHWLQRLNLV